MDKRKKILVGVLVVLLIVTWLFWPQKLNILTDQPATDPAGEQESDPFDVKLPDPVAPVKTNPVFPLKVGSRGNEVKALQEILNFADSAYNSTGGKFLTVDGVFGQKTADRAKFVLGSPIVSESQFLKAADLRKRSIPANSRLNDEFPIRIGSYGPRVQKINVALGVYPASSTFSMNFTAKTQAAVKAKSGSNSLNTALFNQLTGGQPTRPTPFSQPILKR